MTAAEAFAKLHVPHVSAANNVKDDDVWRHQGAAEPISS